MSRLSIAELSALIGARRARELTLDTMPRWAAVSAILKPRGQDDWEVLFIKRAASERDPWSGHMAFPGGRLEEGEDAYTAAVRETQEEIGLDLTRTARYIGQLDDIQATSRGLRLAMVVRPYVFALDESPELNPNEEVDEVVWVPLSSLLAREGAGTYVWHWQGQPIELPCIRFQSYLIWGLTHRMLTELLERIEAPPEAQGPDQGVI